LAGRAHTEQHEVVGLDTKSVLVEHLGNHCLKRRVTDLGFGTTFTTNKMMMRRQPSDFIVGLAVSGIGGDNEAEIDEQPQRSVHGRSIDCSILLLNPEVDIPQGSVPVRGADSIEDQRSLTSYPVSGIPEYLFPA
jgi:hypothetical protein